MIVGLQAIGATMAKEKGPKRPNKKDWDKLDGQRWWTFTIEFPASEEDARWFYDREFQDFVHVICQGKGTGKKHKCRRPFVHQ
jgi:hypothetical protein